MKKTLLMMIFFFVASTVGAQKKWFVTPQIGVNISDMQGSDAPDAYSMAVGLLGGAEVEFRPTQSFGISVGGFYSVKGSSVKDYTKCYRFKGEIPTLNGNEEINRYELSYLSFPLIFNFHVWNGLTLKGGIQYSNLITAREKVTYAYYLGDIPEGPVWLPVTTNASAYTVYQGTKAPDPSPEGMLNPRYESGKSNHHVKSSFHKMDIAIPIGFSYEYQHFVLDIRYQFGLSKTPRHYSMKKVYNRSLSITLGYQL